MNTLIEIQNATIFRLGETLFENLNWKIESAQHWVIVGDTGAGKTSLMQVLSGHHALKSGHIRYAFLPPEIARWQLRQHILHVTFTNRLVSGNDYYYQQRFNISSKEDHTITVRQYLNSTDQNAPHFTILKISELLDIELIILSNGQTRRVLLAKALSAKPELLLLDNPFAGLDNDTRSTLRSFINNLVAHGQRIILTCTHTSDIPDAFTHVLLLQNRKIIFSGLRNQLSAPVPRNVTPAVAFEQSTTDFDIAVQLKNVSVAYGEKKVLNNLNWTIRQGEKWALLGPNGSGKSTLLSLINADNPQAYANNITLFDQPKNKSSIWQIKKRIGYYSPELQAYFQESLTVSDVLLTGLTGTQTIPKNVTEAQHHHISQLLTWYSKQHLLTRLHHSLSSGEQRLVLFLRALVKPAALLILDEPFQGFDETITNQSKELINHVCYSNSLIFVTHYKSEIPSCVTQQFILGSEQL